jgi:hypothetical protein
MRNRARATLVGVMECWSIDEEFFGDSPTTPILQYSITPIDKLRKTP